MSKINFKVEAHKIITRILSIESEKERHETMRAFIQDIHERGEAAAVKSMPVAKVIRTSKKLAPGWSKAGKYEFSREVEKTAEGLADLNEKLAALGNELKRVR